MFFTFTPLYFKELTIPENISFYSIFLQIHFKKVNIKGALFQVSV